MLRSAEAVEVPDTDLTELAAWTRSATITAGAALRARIVLRAGAGEGTSSIARALGVSRPTVIIWRERYRTGGVAALQDAPRSGRPKTVDEAVIISRTLEPPPEHLGVTHWSTRLLASELGVGDATVARCWRRYGLQPWRRETLKFSTDPELEEGPRRHRAVPGPAGQGHRAVRGRVGSGRGAVPSLDQPVSPTRTSEPDVRVSTHPALHDPCRLNYPIASPVRSDHGEGIRFPRYRYLLTTTAPGLNSSFSPCRG